jgi:hypothetical protein
MVPSGLKAILETWSLPSRMGFAEKSRPNEGKANASAMNIKPADALRNILLLIIILLQKEPR